MTGAPQHGKGSSAGARSGGDDGALYEDQIELGDLDNLLPTSEGDFAGVAQFGADGAQFGADGAQFGAGADWDAAGDLPGAADGLAGSTARGRGAKGKTKAGQRSTDAFEFEDMEDGPSPFAGTNGLKATRPGMARASDFGEPVAADDHGADFDHDAAFLAADPDDLPSAAPDLDPVSVHAAAPALRRECGTRSPWPRACSAA